MNLRSWVTFRMAILMLLWLMPVLVYVTLGVVAMYQQGWLWMVAVSLPVLWFIAWLVGLLWKPAPSKFASSGRLFEAPDFWTARDTTAIAIVEKYRTEAVDIDRNSIADAARYQRDAEGLAILLAEHYHGKQLQHAFQPLTVIEIFAVIHLAIEDLEEWTLQNIPGSDSTTIVTWSRLPELAKALDGIQKIVYLASSIFSPGKLLAYPLWRKAGNLTIEIQNEAVRRFYQQYLALIGYYLIEMYSGRLRGGTKQYRAQFGKMATAVHAADGQLEQLAALRDTSTTIAVMGQVKAGKSSLINALIGDTVAATGIMPQTREVKRYEYPIQGSTSVVTLLDAPGYEEADVTKQQLREIATACEAADMMLLVMAANVSARKADLEMVKRLDQHYRERPQLKPPVIIAVLTHIDLLRPLREWSPPYDWRNPNSPKEESIAGAVDYVRELFGDRVSSYVCVYLGDAHQSETSVMDELVPQIVENLGEGKAVAILKAFYKQLSSQRLQRLLKQTAGLLKTVVSLKSSNTTRGR